MAELDGMSDDMIADASLDDIERIMGERGVSFERAYDQAKDIHDYAGEAAETASDY